MSKMPQLSIPDTDKLKIPIPPLAIQKEIVKILDKFTRLEAELEARKKQYEYYREGLLTFGDDVEFRALGEVCDVRIGQAPKDNIVSSNNNYPYINAGLEPSGYIESKNTQPETITIPSRGQGGAGHVGYQKAEFWCGPLCYKIQSSNNKELLTKFVYFYLKMNQESIIGLRKTGSIPAVNRKDLVLVKISIPPLSKQKEIVAILDKFDALVNDLPAPSADGWRQAGISIGLPAEIAARKKQYEYYRNQLLTFKKYE